MADEHNDDWLGRSAQSHDDPYAETPPKDTNATDGSSPSASGGNRFPVGDGNAAEPQGNPDEGDNSDHREETDAGEGHGPQVDRGSGQAAGQDQPTQSIEPVSSETEGQQTRNLYRPAPEYGAYGPAPSPESGQPRASSYGQNPGESNPYGSQRQDGGYGQNSGGQWSGNAQPGQTQGSPQNGAPYPPSDRNPYYTGNPFYGPANNGNDQGNANAGNQGQGPTYPSFGPGGDDGNEGGNSSHGRQRSPSAGRSLTAVWVAITAAIISAALCLGIGFAAITNGWVSVPTTSSLANINSDASGSGSTSVKNDETSDWKAAAAAVSGSVVSIQTTLSNGTAKGSGAVIDSAGYIVTNNHVISDAQSIQVTLSNGQIYSAKVTGTDSTTDLAVIKLDNPPKDLKAAGFADSDKLAVGEAVMAIGNPLGYDDTATTGIVSALNRPVSVTDDNNSEIVTNAVQIDAAINPGNSGGPTFNAAGQVIGINSSIASTATSSSEAGSIGIGFAIPANLVKRVANEIIKNGSVKHVALGITITSATVQADGVTRGGAKITAPTSGGSAVVSGSPAAKAGLQAGDTIVAFNGNAVNNNYSLLGYVRAAALGDKATLTIVRNGKTINVDVTLDKEEANVNGTNSNGNGSGNGEGDGNGQNGEGNGDDGGLTDPFGFW